MVKTTAGVLGGEEKGFTGFARFFFPFPFPSTPATQANVFTLIVKIRQCPIPNGKMKN